MDSVLIIGAGAAGSVVAQKCAMNRDVFKKIHLASRRLVSCKTIAKRCKTPIEISQVDADDVKATVALLKKVKPDLVINMALPYQDLPIMDACLEDGRPLHGHRQLRAARRGQVHLQVAVALP